MKKFKITIDRNACIGCGGCTEIDPTVFAMGEDGKAKLTSTPGKNPVYDNTSGKYNKALDAARSCPVDAIIITEVNG